MKVTVARLPSATRLPNLSAKMAPKKLAITAVVFHEAATAREAAPPSPRDL